MDGEQIPWIDWINEIIVAAEELKEKGAELGKDPSEDIQVLHNMIAISAAEWRDGNKVNQDGPSMGKALGDEESYSPAQIYKPVWGKDTSSVDVSIINNPLVPEFQNIDGDKLMELISDDVSLAAKAYVIILQNKRGYDIWSTWDDFVTNPDTPQYLDYAQQYSFESLNTPSDAVDPDRLFTPQREPGTGQLLKDGKPLPVEKRVTFSTKDNRERQRRWLASVKLKGILSDAIVKEINVD
tara:strand:- start:3572 stop:4291 length:720 start_codon:yes stop_codon:yes gene_type:complete